MVAALICCSAGASAGGAGTPAISRCEGYEDPADLASAVNEIS
ncbi:MAG: hypothetical protein ACOCQP_02090 [Lentisphaeria bacterium]